MTCDIHIVAEGLVPTETDAKRLSALLVTLLRDNGLSGSIDVPLIRPPKSENNVEPAS